MGLKKYNQKRDFKITAEPKGRKAKTTRGDFFCVQKHDATRLHYDFRLELDGVLLSWAVTRGPSINPGDKRLAVRTEDHPLDYGTFEGTIPEGQYGGGTVMLWDVGRWKPLEDPRKGLKSGKLKFMLEGDRLKGMWTLVRMRGGDNEKRENWLLIKDKDAESNARSKTFLDRHITSVSSGRTMDQIAGAANANVWQSNKSSSSSPLSPSSSPRKRGSSLAPLIKKHGDVQLATLVEEAPQGAEWLHEVKFDGYRLLGFISGGTAKLHTRNGHDWTDRFTDLATELAALDVESAVIDMEAVILNEDGTTNFQKLQNILSEDVRPEPIHAFAFDLLHLNGKDLRKNPLTARKQALKSILRGKYLHYSEHHKGDGDKMIANACRMGVEGIISKRADSIYEGRRSRDWLKVKCVKRQEFVILGYTDSTTGKNVIGALHLGYYKGKKLHYAGKVGTGFTTASARALHKLLSALPEAKAPDSVPREARRASHWVKPEQLCEVSFGMWTDEGRIRHASFHALRSDKDPKEVTIEMPKSISKSTRHPRASSRHHPREGGGPANKGRPDARLRGHDNTVLGITISHPERIVFEPLGITKLELAEYYGLAAPAILMDVKEHPITLLRCPGGAEKECFYQRNPAAGMGDEIEPFPWKHKGKAHTYFYTDTPEGIVRMVQMGAIEIHPWGASVKNIDCPDRIIFDCDPGPGVPFEAVKLAAQDLRRRLDAIGLESFVKCTGGKGLHVRVPIAPVTPWADVKDFARRLCERMEEDTPEAYVTTMAKSKRNGKIFLDFFRNDYTATAIADWAVRARDGAPVAVPIEWGDLPKIKSGNQFTIAEATKRLGRKMNPDRYTLKQRLAKGMLEDV